MSLTVGAYPAQPSGLVDREAFFTELADELTVRGLELPYHRDDGDPWPPGAPPHGRPSSPQSAARCGTSRGIRTSG